MSGTNSSVPVAAVPAELPVPAAPLAGTASPRRSRLKMLLVLLVCALPVLASYLTFYVVRPGGGGAAYAALIDPVVAMPEAVAQDLDGRAVPLRQLHGQWLLIVVGDAACGAACEQRLFTQRQLREMTGRERERIDKLWLVTDDAMPAPALRQALEATPGMHILRWPRAQVAQWLRPAAGRALDDHLYLVDPLGRWMMRAPAEPDPARLKRDLERLLRAAAGWDRPGRP